MPSKSTRRIRYVCNWCGSDNVFVDSWVEWDAAKQAWRVADVFESTAYCTKCDGECSVLAEPIGRIARRELHAAAEI